MYENITTILAAACNQACSARGPVFNKIISRTNIRLMLCSHVHRQVLSKHPEGCDLITRYDC